MKNRIIIYTNDIHTSRYLELEILECFDDENIYTEKYFPTDTATLCDSVFNTDTDIQTILTADADALLEKDSRVFRKLLSGCEKRKISVLIFGREEQNKYFSSKRKSDGFSHTRFLQYPFSSKAFRNIIKEYRSPVKNGAPGSSGQKLLSIDSDRLIVRYGKGSAALTEKEFALFLCLYSQAPNAVSRKDLLSSVWNSDDERSSNITDVYINYLRAKFKNSNIDIRVSSVRGVGYKLELV